MTAPRTVPSPWGEPARTPPVSAAAPASPAQSAQSARDGQAGTEAQRTVAPSRVAAQRVSYRMARRRAHRWDHPSRWERVRAAATLVFVAIILGGAAAGVLGVSVWAIAALFHHAASG